MYIKIKVYPEDYGYMQDLARYTFEEVEDDFHEWPEDAREDLIDRIREEAVFEYVETDEQVLEGSPEDDEDY